MKRTGTARWTGDLKAGSGTLKLGSGLFEHSYSFGTRFGETPGTNPEELVGTAHAACFAMAFSSELSKAGHVPRSVDVKAIVEMGMVGGGFQITGITLDATTDVPGIDAATVAALAHTAKVNCPISKALAAVPIALVLNGSAQ